MPAAPPGPDLIGSTAAPESQCAGAVMMVRPAAFGWNPQTEPSNRFQRPGAGSATDLARAAGEEFDALADALRDAGVGVHAFDDLPQPACPDAVFPNNWVSFHADGSVVLYPLLALNRRPERRFDLLLRLEQEGRFAVRRLVDLTHYEAQGLFLEGTGSLVLDRVERVAYACLSPRTHREPLEAFCEECGYEPFVFSAADAAGVPVYHTNVVLSLGSRVAVLAVQNVAPPDRDRLLERLARDGRLVETIGRDQASAFAANVLELRAASGEAVLAMSTRAFGSFAPEARARLGARVDRVVEVPIPMIERVGGGSVRCMLAEVFLPQAEAP